MPADNKTKLVLAEYNSVSYVALPKRLIREWAERVAQFCNCGVEECKKLPPGTMTCHCHPHALAAEMRKEAGK